MYHEAMDVFRARSRRPISIDGQAIHIQSARPAKSVLQLSQDAGFFNLDNTTTALFEQLLQAAIQHCRPGAGVGNAANAANGMDPNLVYMQDPTTGQIYAMTQEEAAQYQAQQGQVQGQTNSQTNTGKGQQQYGQQQQQSQQSNQKSQPQQQY
eukprot:UN30862